MRTGLRWTTLWCAVLAVAATACGILQAHGGTGYLAVTGNVIVGARPADAGLSFSAAPGKLVVAAAGNQVSGVGTVRRSAAAVTLTNGS